jgi:hypothetical protein
MEEVPGASVDKISTIIVTARNCLLITCCPTQ